MAADFALAVDDFFVGQHGPQVRTPVDGSVGDVRQAMFVLKASNGFFALGLDFVGDWQFRNRAAFARS